MRATGFAAMLMACLSLADVAGADSIHKCEVNGRQVYQSAPCAGEMETVREGLKAKQRQQVAQKEQAELLEQQRKAAAARYDKSQDALDSQRSAAAIEAANMVGVDAKQLIKATRVGEYRIADSNNSIETLCTNNWTKRGVLNSQMYNFCVNRQREARSDLKDYQRDYQTEVFYPISIVHCVSDNTKRGVLDVSQAAFCMSNEIEGWKDIQYYKKKYPAAAIDAMTRQQLKQFASWTMAAFSIKNWLEENY